MEYVVWLIVMIGTALGLLSSYTQIFVDNIHFLKCSASSKGGEKQQRLFEQQSKWWTLFYINSVYIILFFLANFYAFKESIPSIHFRYALSTMLPSAAIHLWVNGKNQTNQQQQ